MQNVRTVERSVGRIAEELEVKDEDSEHVDAGVGLYGSSS